MAVISASLRTKGRSDERLCRGLAVKQKRLSWNRFGFTRRKNDCRGIVRPSWEGETIVELSLGFRGSPNSRSSGASTRDVGTEEIGTIRDSPEGGSSRPEIGYGRRIGRRRPRT
jgi:hypothetical protein